MRIAIAGTGRLGTALLNPLLASKHQVVGVIQNGRTCKGYQRWLYPFLGQFSGDHISVAGIAQRHGIPVHYIAAMSEEELTSLRKLDLDLVLVGGFAIILKRPLLDLPKLGCLNTHSSLLPMHRGPNPFSAAILCKDAETGVTFHVMDEDIDTGPIVAQFAFPIEADDTAGSLYEQSSDLAGQHVVEIIDQIEAKGLKGARQDPKAGSYEKQLKPEEMFIDWNQPAEEIHRLVRAGHPFQLARFRWEHQVIYVSRAEFNAAPVKAKPGVVVSTFPGVGVATGRGVLTILVGYTKTPFPFAWPSFLNRPQEGVHLQ